MTYASETWVLKESSIQKLLIFERKILRRIFGPTREHQLWRIKTNDELDKLIKHQNIISHIKTLRLSWFGHVQGYQILEQLTQYTKPSSSTLFAKLGSSEDPMFFF